MTPAPLVAPNLVLYRSMHASQTLSCSSGGSSTPSHPQFCAGAANWNSDATYSYGGEAGAMGRSVQIDTLADRPRARSLPEWQFPGRSAPLVSGAEMFTSGSMIPDAADPAVGILDPLYDEVLNCDFARDIGSYSRAPPGRNSDMSLEHSFDQTHLMRGNSASDVRPLFALSEAQPTVPEDGLMLGSAPARAPALPDRQAAWQAPLFSAYGSPSMYENLFRTEREDAALARAQAPPAAASLPNYQQQRFGALDMLPERRMMASFDASHSARSGMAPVQQALQAAQQGHGLGDGQGSNLQLQHLGPLLASQSAPVRPCACFDALPHCASTAVSTGFQMLCVGSGHCCVIHMSTHGESSLPEFHVSSPSRLAVAGMRHGLRSVPRESVSECVSGSNTCPS